MSGDNEEQSNLEQLKSNVEVLRHAAEKAAFAYFVACPVGPERNRAHDVYRNILYATRIG